MSILPLPPIPFAFSILDTVELHPRPSLSFCFLVHVYVQVCSRLGTCAHVPVENMHLVSSGRCYPPCFEV